LISFLSYLGRKNAIPSCISQLSHDVTKISEKINLKEEKFYLVHSLMGSVHGWLAPLLLGLWVKGCGGGQLPTLGKPESREKARKEPWTKYNLPEHTCGDLVPTTGSHLLKFPQPPNNAIKL
jgi:hypothetical protein